MNFNIYCQSLLNLNTDFVHILISGFKEASQAKRNMVHEMMTFGLTFTLEQATKDQRGSRGIALLFL
jgi:hypothetical protein